MPKKITKEEFINRSILSHPDVQYGYDKVEFHNLRDTILIYCPDCQDYFEQEAMRHMRGSGCPRCTFRKQGSKRKHPNKSRRLNTEEFLRRISEDMPSAFEKYDFSEVNCLNASSRIKIFCKTCNSYFFTKPLYFLRGSGCPECSKRIKSEKVKFSWDQYNKKLQEKFPEGYDFCLLPKGKEKWVRDQKVSVKCIKHNAIITKSAEYFLYTKANNICPLCRKEAPRKYGIYTLQYLKDQIKEIYKGKYTFRDENYKDPNTLLTFYCSEHNEFFRTSPKRLLEGCICESCNDGYKKPGKPMTLEEFIKESEEVHCHKYDYSLIDERDWCGINSYVNIRCPIHNKVYNIHARRHLEGKGKCPECQKEEHSKAYNIPVVEIIRRSKETHGERYDYSLIKEPKRINDKVKIICPKHGVFEVILKDHFSWKGCPACSEKENESLGESLTKDILNRYNIPFKKEKTLDGCVYIGKLRFDFYLEINNKKICIEYQGAQHYMPIATHSITSYDKKSVEEDFKNLQIRDQIKRDFCKKNNIYLIEIPYKYNRYSSVESFLIPKLEEIIYRYR